MLIAYCCLVQIGFQHGTFVHQIFVPYTKILIIRNAALNFFNSRRSSAMPNLRKPLTQRSISRPEITEKEIFSGLKNELLLKLD